MTSKKSTNPRIWICKNDVVKYVLKSKLQSFIDDGYELGRKVINQELMLKEKRFNRWLFL